MQRRIAFWLGKREFCGALQVDSEPAEMDRNRPGFLTKDSRNSIIQAVSGSEGDGILEPRKKKKEDAVGINKGGTAELTSSLESGVVL